MPETQTDFYALLGLDPGATDAHIREAYRQTAWRGDPANGGDADVADAIERAYATLIDPPSRAFYDRHRMKGRRLIGGYEIESLISDGVFARTYRGRDPITGAPVCIKHCHRLGNVQLEGMLIAQARLIGRLRHPSVPVLHRITRLDNGSLVLVMSLLEGESAADIVKRLGAIDVQSVCWITEQVLHAMGYLHASGIVHGKVEPRNIIVLEKAHLAGLVDFGFAMLRPEPDSHCIGAIEPYAPPEQAHGDALMPEADFYALGKTMLYLLTGGDIDAVRNGRIPEHLYAELVDFIRPMIEPNPLRRSQSAKHLIDRLGLIVGHLFGRHVDCLLPIRSA